MRKLVLEQDEEKTGTYCIFHPASSLQKTRRAGEEIMVFFEKHQEVRIISVGISWLEDRRN